MKLKFYICTFFLAFSTFLFSQDYVLIHGWLGNAGDWDNTGVKQLVAGRLPSRILQPSLDGTESASTQSINLRNYLNNNNVNDCIAVSFSMGGMNGRYHLRRQYDVALPSRISQHYTIDSPHYGTAVANNIPLATRIGLVGAAAILWPGYLTEEGGEIVLHYVPHHQPSAALAWALIGAPYLDAILFGYSGPALSSLCENSSAVNYINPPGAAHDEIHFSR